LRQVNHLTVAPNGPGLRIDNNIEYAQVLVLARVFRFQQIFSLLQERFSEFSGNPTTVPIIRLNNTGNIMKNQSIIIAAALVVLTPAITLADSGFVVGASVGSAELSDDFDGFDVDANSTAYRLTVGWKFNDYWTIEGGYHNFGRFDQTFDIEDEAVDVSLKADGFTLGLVGKLPLGDRWSLFARSGAYFWDGDADINNVSAATPEDTNFYFGAGVELAIGEKLSLTADGSRYDLDGSTSNVFSIGLSYVF
jgi:hypothetical protein